MATIPTEQVFEPVPIEEEAIANHLSSLSCSSIPTEPEFDLNLTPPGSPQLLCQTSGDFSMPSPIDSPTGQVDEFGLDGSLNSQNSFWLDDLKTLEQGHVQKLVGDWDKRTSLIPDEELEPFDLKKESNEGRRSIVQPLIEYWESKEKEIVLVSCSGAPGHAQCTGSSLDMESRINCSHCSKPIDNKQDEELFSDLFKIEQQKESSSSLPTLPLLPESLQYAPILPDDSLEREPRFVNPKQYHRILKRRQQRAKYFQNHVVLKQTKPYKHETRHKHANSRPRGPGGRFMKRQTPKKASPEKEFPDAFDPFVTDFFPSGALAA